MAKTRDPSNEIVRKNLRLFRLAAGLTSEDAAQISDVPLDNLRRYESGKSGVPAHALRALAVVYGHAMEDFYMEHPPKPDLANRPMFHFKATPGMEIDEKKYREVQDFIDKVNREVAGKRRK